MRVYAASYEGSVVLHETDERRSPSVLPRKPEEEQARSVGHPASMDDACRPLSLIAGTSIHEKSDRYPVAQTIASTSSSVPSSNTARRPAALVSRPLQRDAGAPEAPRARPDEHVALRQLPPESRIRAHLHEPDAGEPPEEVLAEETLRQRRNALTDGEADLPRRCEFLGDLEAGVPPSHDEHLAIRKLRRVAVVGAVDLEDRVVEVTGDGRNEGHLERTGRNDDLVRRELLGPRSSRRTALRVR